MKATEIKFRAKTKDSREHKSYIEGYYFKTPLTDENSETDPKVGWFFLSDGIERHCISDEHGIVWVIDETTLELIK